MGQGWFRLRSPDGLVTPPQAAVIQPGDQDGGVTKTCGLGGSEVEPQLLHSCTCLAAGDKSEVKHSTLLLVNQH